MASYYGYHRYHRPIKENWQMYIYTVLARLLYKNIVLHITNNYEKTSDSLLTNEK